MKQLIFTFLFAFIFSATAQAKNNKPVHQINHLSEDMESYLCITTQDRVKRFNKVVQDLIDDGLISTLKDAYSDIRCSGGLTLLQYAVHIGHEHSIGIAQSMVKDHHIPLNTISSFHESELDFIRDNRRISEEAGINRSVFHEVFHLVRNIIRNPKYEKIGFYYPNDEYAHFSCELDGRCTCDLEGEVCTDVTTSENKQ